MQIKFIGWCKGYKDIYNDDPSKIPEESYPGLYDALYKSVNDEEKYKRLDELEDLIIKNIIKNKYDFCGEYHQNGDFGSPLFEIDSKKFNYVCTFRYWGGIMARAWNEIDPKVRGGYSYMDFYMGEPHKVPKQGDPL